MECWLTTPSYKVRENEGVETCRCEVCNQLNLVPNMIKEDAYYICKDSECVGGYLELVLLPEKEGYELREFLNKQL